MVFEDCRAVALRGGLLKIGCIQKAAEGIFLSGQVVSLNL